MISGPRRLKEPASESHVSMALIVSAIVMALMLWAIIWQASIIDDQRELKRVLSMARFGGVG